MQYTPQQCGFHRTVHHCIDVDIPHSNGFDNSIVGNSHRSTNLVIVMKKTSVGCHVFGASRVQVPLLGVIRAKSMGDGVGKVECAIDGNSYLGSSYNLVLLTVGQST